MEYKFNVIYAITPMVYSQDEYVNTEISKDSNEWSYPPLVQLLLTKPSSLLFS